MHVCVFMCVCICVFVCMHRCICVSLCICYQKRVCRDYNCFFISNLGSTQDSAVALWHRNPTALMNWNLALWLWSYGQGIIWLSVNSWNIIYFSGFSNSNDFKLNELVINYDVGVIRFDAYILSVWTNLFLCDNAKVKL